MSVRVVLPNHDFRTQRLTASAQVLSEMAALIELRDQNDRLGILSTVTKSALDLLHLGTFSSFLASRVDVAGALGRTLALGTNTSEVYLLISTGCKADF